MANTPSQAAFGNFNRLPRELQDKVWEATAVGDGSPIFQCLEVDFMDGFKESNAGSGVKGWFRPPHVATLYAPTKQLEGDSTANASFYEYVRRVAQTNTCARDAIKWFERMFRGNSPQTDIVMLKAKFRGAPSGQEMSAFMNVKKDLICLHGPSTEETRTFSRFDGLTRLSWFKVTHWWVWPSTVIFRPLPFFDLHRFEHVAIDWNCETARKTIVRDCRAHACMRLKGAYYFNLYRVAGKDRPYCAGCASEVLGEMNDTATDSRSLQATLRDAFHGPGVNRGIVTLAPDEEGFFRCKRCLRECPSGEGRSWDLFGMDAPDRCVFDSVGWNPPCLHWHRSYISTDIDTLLMGRLPALKTFYIIDTEIKLRPGMQLTLPHESFAGHGCKFVEVDTHDEAWDLDRFRKVPLWNSFNSLAYAVRCEKILWRYYTREFTQALMDEQTGDDPADRDVMTDEDGDLIPMEERPLDEWVGLSDDAIFSEVHGPCRGPADSMPVKVGLMTRLDD